MFDFISNANSWMISGLGFFLTLAGLFFTLKLVPENWLVARQNERTNHSGNPRQIGGLIIAPVVLAIVAAADLWGTLPSGASLDMVSHICLWAGLCILFFFLGLLDDLKGLGVGIRLSCQLLAAGLITFSVLRFGEGVVPPIHLGVIAVCAVFATYWINVVNFMDGLDWLTVAGLLPGFLVSAVLLEAFAASPIGSIAVAAAVGALLGFAVYNTPPAQVFLGDSGSLFLGGVSAAAILTVGMTSSPLIAILPFLYYLVDSTLTLGVRIFAREKFWQAHSRHAYQVAFRRGMPLRRITGTIFGLNVVLAILAFWATGQSLQAQLVCLGLGSVLCALIVWLFHRDLS